MSFEYACSESLYMYAEIKPPAYPNGCLDMQEMALTLPDKPPGFVYTLIAGTEVLMSLQYDP